MSDPVSDLESSSAQSTPASNAPPAPDPVHQDVSACIKSDPPNILHNIQPHSPQPFTLQTAPAAGAPGDAPPLTPAPTPSSNSLSQQQHAALLLLLSGKPDAAVAATLKLHRTTVTRWRLHNPDFRQELQQRREELYQSAADRFRTLLVKALMHFHAELSHRNHDYRHEAALQILRLVNTKKLADPSSPPDEIFQRRAAQRPATLEPPMKSAPGS